MRNLKVKVRIKTRTIALYVFITSNKYDFIASDNFFSMEPEQECTIILKNITKVTKDQIQSQTIKKEDFKVSSLYELMDHQS